MKQDVRLISAAGSDEVLSVEIGQAFRWALALIAVLVVGVLLISL